ncbi:MAG: hypothetical protein LBP35_02400 [Candidatus Ancillula trichonymphae]|nr:hypothetical protein [Candidatus Ancillula trichonymphae]
MIALIREPEGKDDDCDYVCNFGYDKDHWTQPLTGIPVEGIINLGHGVECAKFVNDGTTHPEVTITPLSGGVVEHSHIQMVSLGTLSRRQAILGTVMKQQIGGVTIDTPGELARYNYRYEAKFR